MLIYEPQKRPSFHEIGKLNLFDDISWVLTRLKSLSLDKNTREEYHIE